MSGSKNKTRYLILGLLSEQPLSGYEMKKIVDVRFSYFWNESFGQIYPELKKLLDDGAICINDGVVKQGELAKERKVYAILDQGLTELKEWLAEPVEKEIVRYELLLKMYFANLTTPEIMLEHVREFQRKHKRQKEIFDRFEKELRETLDLHENHQAVLMVLLFGQKVWDAYIKWCDEVIQKLGKKTHVKRL